MRRWIAALVFAAAAVIALTDEPQYATAQPPTPVEETITTADGVRLKALFHKSPKPSEGNPVVILLYPPGVGKSLEKPGDWSGLTKTLTDKGFHVFRFDWRGHGKSTDITVPQDFWFNVMTGVWNQKYIMGAPRKGKPQLKNDLKVKEIDPRYFPVYVNDLAAVRMYIDQLNDAGSLNSSSIYLIGAGDAATLGMLWTAAEWDRPAIHPVLGGGATYKIVPTPGIIVDPPAGADIAAAVWLSASRPPMVPTKIVEDWSKYHPKLRDNNHMLFLFGEKDRVAKTQADFFYKVVLVAEGNAKLGVNKLTQSFEAPLKTTLNGVNLLGKNAEIGTEDTIMKYLEARQKDRATIVRRQRTYPGPYFIDLSVYGFRP